MPVKDLGPNRLVVRLFGDRPRSAEVEKYLANRSNNINSDGELLVLPDMGSVRLNLLEAGRANL